MGLSLYNFKYIKFNCFISFWRHFVANFKLTSETLAIMNSCWYFAFNQNFQMRIDDKFDDKKMHLISKGFRFFFFHFTIFEIVEKYYTSYLATCQFFFSSPGEMTKKYFRVKLHKKISIHNVNRQFMNNNNNNNNNKNSEVQKTKETSIRIWCFEFSTLIRISFIFLNNSIDIDSSVRYSNWSFVPIVLYPYPYRTVRWLTGWNRMEMQIYRYWCH